MDFDWSRKWIPGYESFHRGPLELFGTEDREKTQKLVSEISALSLITARDPPIHIAYAMAPDDAVPIGERAQNWKVHHVVFGIKLKEKMDALGIEADLKYPGARSTYQSRFCTASSIRARIGRPRRNSGSVPRIPTGIGGSRSRRSRLALCPPGLRC